MRLGTNGLVNVDMSSEWIAPESCPSLVVLVETVTAPLLIQHAAPVCLELDIGNEVAIPADANQTAELIRAVVAQLLGEMPEGGELTVAATESAGVLELEFADSGCPVESRACSIPMSAAAVGASLAWRNGPHGGAVVAIKFGRGKEIQRRAA